MAAQSACAQQSTASLCLNRRHRLRRAAASPWFILAAVMLVAAALRVPGLERFVESRIGTPCCTLGGDEAYTLRIAMQPLDTILGLPDGGNNWNVQGSVNYAWYNTNVSAQGATMPRYIMHSLVGD